MILVFVSALDRYGAQLVDSRLFLPRIHSAPLPPATPTPVSGSVETPTGNPIGGGEGKPTTTTTRDAATTPIASPPGSGTPAVTATTTPAATPPAVTPSPYNMPAAEVVLHLEDLGQDFRQDKSEAITLSDTLLALGAVSGYVTWFTSTASHADGPLQVQSIAYVLTGSAGAQEAIALIEEEMVQTYTQLAAPGYGDQSLAFVAESMVEERPYHTYYVFLRAGNVLAGVLVAGFASVTELEDATPYAQRILAKLGRE